MKKTTRRQGAPEKKRNARSLDKKKLLPDSKMVKAVTGLRAWDRYYRDQRARYQQFLDENRNRPSHERAVAWLRFAAAYPDGWGDEEALVYLASQNLEISELIEATVQRWKEAESRIIAKSLHGRPLVHLLTGKTTYKNPLPPASAKDIEHASEFLLPPFWSGADEQMLSLDATMLRAVEWCDIGGFDAWWKRLARITEENVALGGLEPEPATAYLFNMTRSPFAIDLMPRALIRFLEACELTRDGELPWITYRPTPQKQGAPDWQPAEDNSYAAQLVFSAYRLRGTAARNGMTDNTIAMLQRNQRADGSWPYREGRKSTDIETTAICIHALSCANPRGWQRQARKAAAWLRERQNEGGHWVENTSPDPVYLTVLVMDALAIASGSSRVTFRKPEPVSYKQHVSTRPARRRFKIAVSFPGEVRDVVEKVVRLLQGQLGKESVFYDSDHKAELAGPDLDLKLLGIYRDDAELLVVFIAPGYLEKQWCGLEWRSIRELVKTGRRADIMFLRLKDAVLPPGMLSIDGYADISDMNSSEITDLIVQRLK